MKMALSLPRFFFIISIIVTFHIYTIYHYKHAVSELEGWNKEAFRNVTHYINLVPYVPDNFCKYNTSLLIMVHSRPGNQEARNAIRNSWGNKSILYKHNASLFFLLGQNRNFSVRRDTMFEFRNHEDIIVEDFVDGYSNLTLKSVTMLKFFTSGKNCRYLLKADEDVFVNIAFLMEYLEPYKYNKYLLTGRLVRSEIRKNDVYKKWYAPKYMYLGHKYPDFLAGPAYLMNLDTAKALFEAALKLPLFHLEDVFVTGICAMEAGIKRIASGRFTDYRLPIVKCKFLKIVTAHSFNPGELIRIQNSLKVLQEKCSSERFRDYQFLNGFRIL